MHCIEPVYVISLVMLNISREIEETSSTKATRASQMDSTVFVNLLTTWDDQILGFIENTKVNHESFQIKSLPLQQDTSGVERQTECTVEIILMFKLLVKINFKIVIYNLRQDKV